MAAPLITRTPIINDDLSGKTGTIIDNAWKQELYNQIDADVAAVVAGLPASPILRKATGINSALGTVTIDSLLVPALIASDTLRVSVTIQQAGAAGTGLYLSAVGDVNLIRLDDIGGGSLGVSARGTYDVSIRMDPSYPLAYDLIAVGGIGTGGAIRTAMPIGTTASWTAGGWTLGLVTNGQAAGGALYWSWSVTKA